MLNEGGWSTARPSRSTPGTETRCPIYTRLCWPQGPSGQMWKLSRPAGSDPRSVQPVISRYTNQKSRPTRLRMSGAKPLLPLYGFKEWTEDFFLHNNSSRNPNKGNLHNFGFKRMNITDLFLCHRPKDVTPNMLVLRWNSTTVFGMSLVRTFAVAPFIQKKFPWFFLVLTEEQRESASKTSRPLR